MKNIDKLLQALETVQLQTHFELSCTVREAVFWASRGLFCAGDEARLEGSQLKAVAMAFAMMLGSGQFQWCWSM